MLTTTTAYAYGLAARFLHGAGSLTLVPYQVDPQGSVAVLAHGLDADGNLIVVCPADEADMIGSGRVRIDGMKKGLEFDVDITVASLHALAEVEWQEDSRALNALGLAEEEETESLHLRVGTLTLDTLYVRGPQGTTKCFVEHLDLHTPRPLEIVHRELDAREEIDRLSLTQLSTLLSSVLVNMEPGLLLSEREQAVCMHHQDRLWVIDIDSLGMVLLKAIDGRLTTVLVSFPEPVYTIADLAGAIDSLAARTSLRHASPRI